MVRDWVGMNIRAIAFSKKWERIESIIALYSLNKPF